MAVAKRRPHRHTRALRSDAGHPRKPKVTVIETPATSIETVFVPDSLIPRQVLWDGYGRIRPWISRYVHDTYGCILSKCQMRWDPVERGHWVTGPQKGK